MNLVTAGNSVKHSKPAGKGYRNHTVFKARLNKPHFYKKVHVRGYVCGHAYEVSECGSESTFCRRTLKVTKVFSEQGED